MCDSSQFSQGDPIWSVTGGVVISTKGNEVTIKWSKASETIGDKIVKAVAGNASYEYKVTVVNVSVSEGSVTTQKVKFKIVPEGLTGIFEILVASNTTSNFEIYSENNKAGSNTDQEIVFDIDPIPVGLYDSIVAKWYVTTDGHCAASLAHKFQALGEYRNSQYNSPNEAKCGGDPVNIYVTSVGQNCIFTASTFKSQFKDKVDLNGSGESINSGKVQIEFFCLNSPNAPADASGKSYRGNLTTYTLACANGTLSNTTVAITKNHPHLSCNDEVYISGIGKKTVTDHGGGLVEAQLDNYTTDDACAGINDLGNKKVFKIFQ